jgi:hypothetical protein
MARSKRSICSNLRLAFTLAVGLGILLHPGSASAQGTGMPIYTGETLQSGALTVSAWGSGTVEENLKTFYSGSSSLKIVTQGYYQGATIKFKRPFDLGAYAANKNALIQFVVLVPETGAQGMGGMGSKGLGGSSFSGGSSFPGGPGAQGGSSFPGGSGSSFPGGPGGRGGRGGMGGMRTQQAQTLQHLRLLMITTTGKPLEVLVPLSYAREENQWKLLSIPVPAIGGLSADDAKIQEVRVFGDTTTTLYLGKIGVVVDSTPIKVEPQDEKNVSARDTYRYIATASAGATPLKYSWDWDASDGIQEESVGRVAHHAYYKVGDYTITVTVTDAYGTKAPASTSFKVHVHQ